ncbi:MAG: hypothetical protein V4534_07945 [Myxococcota bacterium]
MGISVNVRVNMKTIFLLLLITIMSLLQMGASLNTQLIQQGISSTAQDSKYRKQLDWKQPLEYGSRWAIESKLPVSTHNPLLYRSTPSPLNMVCQSGIRCLSGESQMSVNPLTGTVLGY